MEPIKIAEAILKEKDNLKSCIKELPALSEQKDILSAKYELALARTLIGLKNGTPFLLDDEEIENPPASIMDKLARGICWQEKLKADTADSKVKAQYSKIDAIKAVINAYQSINRYLSEA